MIFRTALAVATALILSSTSHAEPTDLLPDIIVRQADLFDHQITNEGGRRLLRLSNGTANIGTGKLYLYGLLPPNPDGSQDVMQRVYRDDGSFWERLAGKFIYHPGHGHIHFENWALYRLREILPDEGVGPIVAQSAKTSFCILDLQIYDTTLPGFNPAGQFRTCGASTQGLSVGWMDIYSKGLAGQFIDISFVNPGQYWLESEVDPFNSALESDETNNITRIKVTVTGVSGPISPDPYEPNDRRDQVSPRPVGLVNSPNLGPVGPETTLSGLTINAPFNADYFRFYNPGTGVAGDLIRLSYMPIEGDLAMELVSDAGQLIQRADVAGGTELISLFGRPRGWYYIRVYPKLSDTNPNYSLTINPAQSAAPTVAVTAPPAGDVHLKHGEDTYRVEWTASDPDGDPTWATIYMNTKPTFDGSEVQIPTSLHTPGEFGFHVVNSAYVEPGTYWVYVEITDGGVKTGSWSAGTVSFHEMCTADLNHDHEVDADDYDLFIAAFDAADPLADFNADGFIDYADILAYLNVYAEGCH